MKTRLHSKGCLKLTKKNTSVLAGTICLPPCTFENFQQIYASLLCRVYNIMCTHVIHIMCAYIYFDYFDGRSKICWSIYWCHCVLYKFCCMANYQITNHFLYAKKKKLKYLRDLYLQLIKNQLTILHGTPFSNWCLEKFCPESPLLTVFLHAYYLNQMPHMSSCANFLVHN